MAILLVGVFFCVCVWCVLKGSTSPNSDSRAAAEHFGRLFVSQNKTNVPDVIVHFFMILFTNAKSSDSDTHEWINEILFCCSFSRMPRHLIVTCMNLSMASMLDVLALTNVPDDKYRGDQCFQISFILTCFGH